MTESLPAILLSLSLVIAALLVLVLRLKLPAFLALLLVSAGFGLANGMGGKAVLESIQNGMGGTLGFVAVVVGLGSMFGGLLEAAGGIGAIAQRLLKQFGDKRASSSLGVVGFVVAIPVFFDVAFILLVPLVLQLAARSQRAPLYYAIPLLAGLAVAHAFIPPTPGPIAVAELVGAELGWVIALGAICGLPAMIIAGPLFARRFRDLPYTPSNGAIPVQTNPAQSSDVSFASALFAVLLPLLLIIANALGGLCLAAGAGRELLAFLGHPFVALMLACLYAYLVFGVRRRVPLVDLRQIMTRALEPAGIVVLVTGAGGVFKQVLIDSGVGQQLGAAFAEQALPILPLAFVLTAIVRVAQGSATVAMITGAGLVAPIAQSLSLSAPQTALVVIAVSAGATVASHVNDSGFWLISRYLHLSEAQTLRSWTVASTLIGVVGLIMAMGLSLLL